MAINIPNSVFTTYNEAVLLFTRTGRLIYPEKKEECPNCYLDTFGTGGRSISFYKTGGPYPFERGMPCPYCGGKGYKAVESYDDIILRVNREGFPMMTLMFLALLITLVVKLFKTN